MPNIEVTEVLDTEWFVEGTDSKLLATASIRDFLEDKVGKTDVGNEIYDGIRDKAKFTYGDYIFVYHADGDLKVIPTDKGYDGYYEPFKGFYVSL